MKRTLALLLSLALLLPTLCLFSCNIYMGGPSGGDFTDTSNVKGAVTDGNGGNVSVRELSRFATKEENFRDTMVSWYDDEYNYYVFRVGQIKNVPLTSTYAVFYYDGRGAEYTESRTVVQATESSIAIGTTQAIRSSVSVTEGFRVNGSISGGIAGIGTKVEAGYSKTTANTNEQIWTRSRLDCEKAYAEQSQTFTVTFSKDAERGNYLYLLLGNVNVYYAVVQSRTAPSEYYVETYSEIAAHKYVFNYTGEENDEFPVDGSQRIEVDLSFVPELPAPSQYVKTEEPKEEAGTQEEPKVFTGYWGGEVVVKDASMSQAKGHFWCLEIPEIAQLAEEGNNKIKISYEFWVKGGWHLFGGNVDVECYISHTEDTDDAIHHQTKASSTDGKWIRGSKTADLHWFKKDGKIYLILFNENLSESFTVSKVKITAEVYRE